MTTALKYTPKGRDFVRAVIARTFGGTTDDARMSFAAQRWGDSTANRIERAVAALSTSDLESTHEAREFFDLVREKSIIGRLNPRMVPFNVRVLTMATGTQGYWIAEGSAKRLSLASLSGAGLSPLKVAAIICVTKEALTAEGNEAEAGLQRDLERAVTDTLDLAFIDYDNSGAAGERPASVTSVVSAIPASGDPVTDLRALIEAFSGDLDSAFIVTDPNTATQLALRGDTSGQFLFPDLGPRGGSVLGIPVITSRMSPTATAGGQIALLDSQSIAAGMGGLALDRAEHASLEMDSAPTGNSTTPTETTQVSLWQTGTVAFRAEIAANWRVEREGGVAVLTDASY